MHEYGGGAWAVGRGLDGDVMDGEVVVFSDFGSDRVFRADPSGDQPAPRPITPAGRGLRYADLRVHADRDLVLAVREDHRDVGEPVNTVVALSLSGPNTDGGRVLCSGADFYASPELGADGRLAWVQWDHPNMPWDQTTLWVGRLGESGVDDPRPVGGTAARSSVMAPSWHGDRPDLPRRRQRLLERRGAGRRLRPGAADVATARPRRTGLDARIGGLRGAR